jgi:periplasmic divalent cation tolerance protein
MSAVIVLCTAPDSGATEEMVRTLVHEGVVACGNIVADVNSIKQRLPQLHPYDVPELLLFKVTDGLASYLKWVEESTAVPDPA